MRRKCKDGGGNPQQPPAEDKPEVTPSSYDLKDAAVAQREQVEESAETQITVKSDATTKATETEETKVSATITEKAETVFDKNDPFDTTKTTKPKAKK